MEEMKEFALWFLSELPDFLLSEPICYFVGIVILFFVVKLTVSIIHINN